MNKVFLIGNLVRDPEVRARRAASRFVILPSR